MRLALTLVLIVVCGCASSPKADNLRIDGTSDASFDKSYVSLVQTLSPQEQRSFALALFGVLLPEKCLSPEGVFVLTFLPASPEHAPQLRTCRAQLNGKSYQDIVVAADSKKTTSLAAPPNNRWRGP